MKQEITTPGKTYSVHTMKGCTIIEPDGWSKTIEAPDGYFDAHFGSVVIEGDDETSIKQLFKLAPYQKLRLLGVVGGNAGGLPAGYKRVEYLQGDGKAYIKTDIFASGLTEIEATYARTNDNTQQSLFFTQCGSYPAVDWRTASRLTSLRNNGTTHFILNRRMAEPEPVPLFQKSTLRMTTGDFYQDGIKILTQDNQWPPVEQYPQPSIALFCTHEITYNDNGTVIEADKCTYPTNSMRCYGFKTKGAQNSDFIPALDPTGAPCMYDLVSRKAFYNAGSGDFLYPTESTTYALRRVLPDWGKLTPNGLRRLYHAPANYTGELYDYALENGYKPIVETEKPEDGYWSPRWTETEDEIILEWVETDPPTDEFGLPAEPLTETE